MTETMLSKIGCIASWLANGRRQNCVSRSVRGDVLIVSADVYALGFFRPSKKVNPPANIESAIVGALYAA